MEIRHEVITRNVCRCKIHEVQPVACTRCTRPYFFPIFRVLRGHRRMHTPFPRYQSRGDISKADSNPRQTFPPRERGLDFFTDQIAASIPRIYTRICREICFARRSGVISRRKEGRRRHLTEIARDKSMRAPHNSYSAGFGRPRVRNSRPAASQK